MRLFQNSSLYSGYVDRLSKLRRAAGANTFAEMMSVFVDDRFGAPHYLAPILEGSPEAFLAVGQDDDAQNAWAKEAGLPASTSNADILLAQIEHHRTEVFYNLDPVRFDDRFLARLPGCVRRTIAWNAAPFREASFFNHDLVVSNFPTLLAQYRSAGAKTEYFFPAHDPVMDAYRLPAKDRLVDIGFVGSYSRHHVNRAAVLRIVATSCSAYRLQYHLEASRLTRLAEGPVRFSGLLSQHRRPREVRHVANPPLFGRELYAFLGRCKVVLNGAIDIAGPDRGNMRCWEATGCGAALLTDAGNYPPGFDDMIAAYYETPADAAAQAKLLVDGYAEFGAQRAEAGYDMVRTRYSKQRQMDRFRELI